jgi:hypothetical protein
MQKIDCKLLRQVFKTNQNRVHSLMPRNWWILQNSINFYCQGKLEYTRRPQYRSCHMSNYF